MSTQNDSSTNKPKADSSGTLRTRFDPCRPEFIDRIFKEEQGVQLPLRIWPASSPSSSSSTPWLLWIHGGGFQSGNPYSIDPWIHPAFGEKYHIVSISYRYIPQADIFDEIQDCIDAHEWCTTHLPSLLPGIDIDTYLVAGDSAGGCLATLMGHHLSPKPKVVLDIYGVVDFLNPHYYNPYDAALDLTGKGEWEAKLKEGLGDRDKANAEHTRLGRHHLSLPFDVLKAFFGLPELQDDREKFVYDRDLYDYTTKVGKRIITLLRLDDLSTQEEKDQRCREVSALHLLEGTNKGEYPPTYILHGTGDALVPVQESYAFEKRLKELGVDVGSYYPEGEPHAFDQRINGPGDEEDWKVVVEPILRFVGKYIKA